jgi:mRNA-degrading endonuclease RelE of RelBE toxin-antitoxin system
MRVIRLDDFERALKRLPAETVARCEVQLTILEENCQDVRLHTKKLRGTSVEIFSFRIGRNYRGLFYFDNDDNIVVFDIGNRKDIYR